LDKEGKLFFKDMEQVAQKPKVSKILKRKNMPFANAQPKKR
jgi:hypothetical protein